MILINHGTDAAHFARGDRIAQLLIVPAPTIDWVEVDDLDETGRGAGEFSSTGR